MVVFHQRSSSINGCYPSRVIFHERFLPSKAIINQRSSSIKGCLPSKVVFQQRLCSIKGCLPSKGHLSSKDIFHQMLSSIEAVCHQRSSSITGCLPSSKGCLPSKVVIHQRFSSIWELGLGLEFDNIYLVAVIRTRSGVNNKTLHFPCRCVVAASFLCSVEQHITCFTGFCCPGGPFLAGYFERPKSIIEPSFIQFFVPDFWTENVFGPNNFGPQIWTQTF